MGECGAELTGLELVCALGHRKAKGNRHILNSISTAVITTVHPSNCKKLILGMVGVLEVTVNYVTDKPSKQDREDKTDIRS